MRKLAQFFSLIFHFMFLGPLTFFVINREYSLGTGNVQSYYPSLLALFYIVIPFVIFQFLMRTGRVTDFDVTDRRQRPLLNLYLIGTSAVFLLLTFLLPVSEIIKLNVLYSFLFTLVFAIITYFWKISYHLGCVGWFSAVVLHVYGINFVTLSSLLLIALLTGWSRLYLKKHTFAQATAGFSLALLMYLLLRFSFYGSV